MGWRVRTLYAVALESVKSPAKRPTATSVATSMARTGAPPKSGTAASRRVRSASSAAAVLKRVTVSIADRSHGASTCAVSASRLIHTFAEPATAGWSISSRAGLAVVTHCGVGRAVAHASTVLRTSEGSAVGSSVSACTVMSVRKSTCKAQRSGSRLLVAALHQRCTVVTFMS